MLNLAISKEFARNAYTEQRRRRAGTLIISFLLCLAFSVLLFMDGRSNAHDAMQDRLDQQVGVLETSVKYGLVDIKRALGEVTWEPSNVHVLTKHTREVSMKWPELVYVFVQPIGESMQQIYPQHQYFGVPVIPSDIPSVAEQLIDLPIGGQGLVIQDTIAHDSKMYRLISVFSLKALVDRWFAAAKASDLAIRLLYKGQVALAVAELSAVRVSRQIESPFGERNWQVVISIPSDNAGYLKFNWSARLILTLAALLMLGGWLIANSMRRRDAIEIELETYRYLIDTLGELLIEIDRDFMVVYANKTACNAFRLHQEEFNKSVSVLQLMSPMSSHEFQQSVENSQDHSGPTMITLQLHSARNMLMTCEVNVSALLSSESKSCVGFRLVMRDVTERRRADQQLKRLAHYDALTDLPNRALCTDRLTQALARAQRNSFAVALLYIDLDDFKRVNESHSVAVGDIVLQVCAERLLKLIRKTDTLARIAGDEFVLIAADILHHQDASKVAQRLADQILEEFERPFECVDDPINLTSSIGIAIYPRDASSHADVMKFAHSAMFHAKVHGKGATCFFTPEMRSVKAEDELSKERLRKAMQNDELELHYQAMWDARENRVVAVEALLRWNAPERGLVSPLEFIPLIESAGLSDKLTELVLLSAAKQYAAWRDQGLDVSYVALNLSANQFSSENFIKTVEWVLNEMRLPEKVLQLEVTEATLMEHGEVASGRLQKLSSLGVRVAIDDFGSGYSSINFLKRFPVDEIKVDPTFTRDIELGANHRKAITAVMQLANSLGIQAVAEGVESEMQMSMLLELGCNYMMGFGLSRPEDAQSMTKRLSSGKMPPKKT